MKKKVICPNCQSDRVYSSQLRSMKERFNLVFMLKRPFRCHHCYERFAERFWYQNWGKPQLHSEWRDK